jgi:hypothetical protein
MMIVFLYSISDIEVALAENPMDPIMSKFRRIWYRASLAVIQRSFYSLAFGPQQHQSMN